MTALAVALAGGLGAVLRLLADALVVRLLPTRVPVATVLINVTGSFLLGLVLGAATSHAGWTDLRLVVGTGVLGGYTTFSTASVEAVGLARQDSPRAVVVAVAHATVMLVAAVAAATLGWVLTAP
ncbi:MAG TPA: CrcB family protein [Cellulomonas sp.]